MMEVFVIVFDYHPLGDYVVTAARMNGFVTEEEDIARAASLEEARSFLPPGPEPVAFNPDPRVVEIWF